MNITKRQRRAFWLGVYSVFTLDRVRIFGNTGSNTNLGSVEDLKKIRPFANDADALRRDAEKVGHDIHRAITEYERIRTQ
jgi:hypothetical protein